MMEKFIYRHELEQMVQKLGGGRIVSGNTGRIIIYCDNGVDQELANSIFPECSFNKDYDADVIFTNYFTHNDGYLYQHFHL